MSQTLHSLAISSVRHVPGDAVVLTFDVPEALRSTLAFKPGQHVGVRATIDGVEQRRTYTVCTGSGSPLRIAIRHIQGGIFSTWARSHLKAGDKLDIEAPQGRFCLPPAEGKPRHFLMLAGGVGITPILGMTIEALKTEPNTTITLVYGMRTLHDGLFLDELEDLKDLYAARLDLISVLSRPGEADGALFAGRINGEKVKALAQHRIDVSGVTRAYLCGPGDFIKETRNALFDLGLAKEKVAHEFFAGRNAGGAQPPAAQVPPKAVAAEANAVPVTAIIDGQRHNFTLAPGQNVLEAALSAGLKPPHSCTAGMCSTCRARVVEGKVTMDVNYSLEPWELERGFVLTCQARPTSPALVIDYDAM